MLALTQAPAAPAHSFLPDQTTGNPAADRSWSVVNPAAERLEVDQRLLEELAPVFRGRRGLVFNLGLPLRLGLGQFLSPWGYDLLAQ